MKRKCPVCHKTLAQEAIPARDSSFPFCSPRCRLLDLGAWLDCEYRVTTLSLPDESDDPSDTPDIRSTRDK